MTVVFLETLHLVDVTQIFKEESTEKQKKTDQFVNCCRLVCEKKGSRSTTGSP